MQSVFILYFDESQESNTVTPIQKYIHQGCHGAGARRILVLSLFILSIYIILGVKKGN